jgi:hypothetical protein
LLRERDDDDECACHHSFFYSRFIFFLSCNSNSFFFPSRNKPSDDYYFFCFSILFFFFLFLGIEEHLMYLIHFTFLSLHELCSVRRNLLMHPRKADDNQSTRVPRGEEFPSLDEGRSKL